MGSMSEDDAAVVFLDIFDQGYSVDTCLEGTYTSCSKVF